MLPVVLWLRRRSRAKRRTTAMFFCAVAGSVSRQIVAELDVEQPVHALDAPMAATSLGGAFDVEWRGADVGAGIASGAVGMFGLGVDLDDGLDGGETRLPRIAAIRHDPVDRLRGGVGAGFDAAMRLLDGCFGNE